jgi:anti-anti-sigma factor
VNIDLSELTFLGCAGLNVLAVAGIRYRAAGGRITLTHLSPTARRMLQITGLDTTLHSDTTLHLD